MKKSLLITATVVSLSLVGSALAGSEPGYHFSYSSHSYFGHAQFDPILDADILALRGAPGTATLVTHVPFDPILDADILALGGAPGTTTLDTEVVLDPILDADLLAVSTGSGPKYER